MKNELISLDLKILNCIHKSVNFKKNDIFFAEYDKNVANCYDVDEISLLKIFQALKDNLKYIRKKELKQFDYLKLKLNFLNVKELDLKFIKNEGEYLIALWSLMILKSFAQKKFKIKTGATPREEEEKSKYYSYTILNHTSNQFDFFIKWVSLQETVSSRITKVSCIKIIRTLIIFLQEENLITKLNINKTTAFTEEYWIPRSLIITPITHPNIYLTAFKYTLIDKNYYAYTNHFSNMIEVLVPNKDSGKTFKLGDDRILNNLANASFCLDINFLKKIFNDKLSYYNIKEEGLFDQYENLLTELRNLLLKKDLSILSEISRRISVCEDLIRIYNLIRYLKKDTQIFLPFIFDFRGRLYYKSDASPTFYTEMRYCMYNLNNKNPIPRKGRISEKITKLLKEHFYLLNTLNDFNFDKFDDRIKEGVIWVLVAAAEYEKTKLGKKVKLEAFIKHGIFLINNFSTLEINWEFNKKLHIWYSYEVLKEIMGESNKIRYFKKDSTASVYQMLIKRLGWKDTIFLKCCNLSSEDTWYDTYEHILDNFKGICELKYLTSEQFSGLFNRKNFKKSIMTENYLATFNTFRDYFLKEIDLKKFSDTQQKEILNLVKSFFNFLRKNENLFEINPQEITIYIKSNNYTFELVDKSQINLIYQLSKSRQDEIVIQNKRHTKKFNELTNEINKKKIDTSSRANYVHSLDAAQMREVLLWGYANLIDIFGLHDCWMVGYLDITDLIIAVNETSNKTLHDHEFIKIKEEFYSPFIVL